MPNCGFSRAQFLSDVISSPYPLFFWSTPQRIAGSGEEQNEVAAATLNGEKRTRAKMLIADWATKLTTFHAFVTQLL